MLRLLPLALTSLLLALSGCGSDDDEDAAPSTTAATETQAGEQLRVGLITDLGQLDDNGFNELAFKGLKRAESELGVKGRVIESVSAADYIPNMTRLARDGYDLVIGVGFAQGDAIGKVAQKYPDTSFAIIDVDQAFVPGNFAGAEKAAPGITLIHDYSQDWDDQAKCKELALNQIARGSNVVFQVAGGCGLGALNAAGERDRWGIGVDADQSFLGTHILTSALKGVDSAVFLTIVSIQDGSWEGGGNATFGLEEDGVGLGKVSPDVPDEDVEQVQQIKQQIADGEIEGIPTEVGK